MVGCGEVDVIMLEELLQKEFQVLDKGYVRLIDVMGSDERICDAARISYGKGTRRVQDNRNLIRYLMRHSHTTPFEHAELQFIIQCPMDTWRQFIRHRTANVNEYSTRYSEAIDIQQRTAPQEWRSQATTNRQGSGGFVEESIGEILSKHEALIQNWSYSIYQTRLQCGVAREQARKDLPLSTYTRAYWKIDLHNLLHFLTLRMDEHAQYELRQYANIIGFEVVRPLFPLTWEAFEDYRLGSIQLSRLEIGVLKRLLEVTDVRWDDELFDDCQDLSWKGQKRSRERDECKEKLHLLFGEDIDL
jgi:thymidylate synthase (FAD)